jgi:HprK-related kinase B
MGMADTPQPIDANSAAAWLLRGIKLLDVSLKLSAHGCTLEVFSNSQQLLDRLADYFAHLPQQHQQVCLQVVAIECPVRDHNLAFVDWRREPGKTGRKDAYVDLLDARLVLKVRTGMLFLQSETQRIAAGPCLANDNQLINFINSQWMNRLQQQGWLICHAAALEYQGSALALAGFSGNGKSTLMLHLLELPKFRYLTNDRLFVRANGPHVTATGIPKLPRINPGTLLNNPRLVKLLPAHRQQAMRKLTKQALWALEEKHDVDVALLYGKERIDTATPRPLKTLLILNWSHTAKDATQFQRVDLLRRRDLLPAVMKSPGPFYQDSGGLFQHDDGPLLEENYQKQFKNVEIIELTGKIDFDRAIKLWSEKVNLCY